MEEKIFYLKQKRGKEEIEAIEQGKRGKATLNSLGKDYQICFGQIIHFFQIIEKRKKVNLLIILIIYIIDWNFINIEYRKNKRILFFL